MRHRLADGLKVLALLGVFMVNGLGYALAPHYTLQLGAPVPLDSTLAQAIHALVLILFMGKALPFLAFLFGYSMTLYAKRIVQVNSVKRRCWKLLLIGVLHGSVLYFGDILTGYALIGLWLGSTLLLRGRLLVHSWRKWALLGLLFFFPWLVLEWISYQPNVDYAGSDTAPALAQFSSFGPFFAHNLAAYMTQTLGWLIVIAPLHMALFLTGALAARYRWLSNKPRLPQLFLRPWLYRSWPLALLANALLALLTLQAHQQVGLKANIYWITLVNIPISLWLVASVLTGLMQFIQTHKKTPQWIMWLAPAGRHTLAMYLGLSLVLMLFGRLGLFASNAVWNHTAVWFLALLVLWFGAVWMGRIATQKRLRDPVSRWLSR